MDESIAASCIRYAHSGNETQFVRHVFSVWQDVACLASADALIYHKSKQFTLTQIHREPLVRFSLIGIVQFKSRNHSASRPNVLKRMVIV
jgi:hypothetical protein